MKIYDELTNAELTAPDESAGYLYTGQRVVKHVAETTEIMVGTVTADCPQGLRRIIPAHDVYEDCQYYHAYTAEERDELENYVLRWDVRGSRCRSRWTLTRRPF